MRSAAVLAHADPHGRVGDHVLRHLRELSTVVGRVVVVSSAPLRPEAAAALGSVADLVAAPGATSCWGRWGVGLDRLGSWQRLDRLVLADDDLVGPFRPLVDVLGAGRPDRLRGLVATGPHLQRHLLDHGREVVGSSALAAFWTGVQVDEVGGREREQVLEKDLSRAVAASGWPVEPMFRPGPADRARARGLATRRALGRAVTTSGDDRRAALAELRRPPVRLLDPMAACWYRSVDGSLPYASLTVLAEDPERVGRGRMLRRLEGAHPGAMGGVRRHLERLASDSLRPTTSGGAR